MRVPRPLRWLLALAGLALAAVHGTILWLLRDPTPHFDARRGVLASVEADSARLDGATSEQDVRITGSSGLHVTLAIRRPAAAEPAPIRRPLFVVLGGHERGKGAGALIGDTRGAIFASLEYPFDGNHRARGPREVLAQIPAIRRAIYDTPPSVALALDYLLSRPDVDPARIELIGASFGTPFATIAAARDERITRLWLAHGGGDLYRLISRGLERDVPAAWLRAPLAHTANLLVSGPRFTPERWIAAVAPRPVVMLNAEDDEKIPRESVELLYAAAGQPKELVWLPGRHMQGSRPEVIQSLVAAVLARADLTPAPSAPR